MAKIAIIKPFYGMTINGAQLAGELIAHGHIPKVIYFKKQEAVPIDNVSNGDYQLGDVPMQNHIISKSGCYIVETSVWKKTKPHELQRLVKTIQDFGADAIGISTLSHSMTFAAEITSHLRQHFNIPILWGGTGPTVEPERSIEYADLVCVGEGEGVLVEVANRLDKKQGLSGILGTWYKQSDGVIEKNPKCPLSNLEEIAVPNWDAENYVYINGPRFESTFQPDAHSVDKSYHMMTQRGCPFSCSFCVESFYQDEFGKKDSLRRMSPEKAIRELIIAKERYGAQTVTFMDDVFTINPRWLKKFLSLYKQKVSLPFFCYTYPTTHNTSILAMIEDAGCHAITMGVQSGSDRILTEIYDRPTKTGRVVEAAYEIVNSGIPASSFDMIPYTEFDTEEDLRATLEVMLKIPKQINTTFYTRMAYFPNYPIQEKFKDSALISRSEKPSHDTYSYYFKLFEITRTEMDVDKIRALAADPRYRANHELLNPYLPENKEMKPGLGSLILLGMERRKNQSLPTGSHG